MTDAPARITEVPIRRRRLFGAIAATAAAGLLGACGLNEPRTSKRPGEGEGDDSIARPRGWSSASHGKGAEPGYATVFPADRVSQITIRIAPDDWAAMLANMSDLFGPRGSGREAGVLEGGDDRGRTTKPAWSRGTIEANGLTWTNVGVRFKGYSSLRAGWAAGTDSLPFKLDFDQWDSDYPEIRDQRFHGFKQIALAKSVRDPSHMRDSLAAELLDRAGLVAARTAPYEVILDRGEGETSLGLYTAIEVIDDTAIRRAFPDAAGAVYDAEGPAASFAPGTRDGIASSFKATGRGIRDVTPLEALYDHLHSNQRTVQPAAWRAKLEELFDVPAFLEWLGLAATLQHWDSYGQAPKNFYLYHNPGTARLTWISWDHDLILGVPPVSGRALSTASWDRSRISEGWPLIRSLLDDPAYEARYLEGLRTIAASVFLPGAVREECERRAALLRPFAGDQSEFDEAVSALEASVDSQAAGLAAYLASR